MSLKISIYGTQLPAMVCAACLADIGNDVLWVAADFDPIRDDILSYSRYAIAEPELLPCVKRMVEFGRLRITNNVDEGVDFGQLQYLFLKANEFLIAKKIAESLGDRMVENKVLINRSIFPVGSSDSLQEEVFFRLKQREVTYNCQLIVEPDFMVEGRLMADFTRPDRIILGSDDSEAIQLIYDLYAPYNRQKDVIMIMAPRSAELTKFAVNAMLATRISFMNEVSEVAEYVSADIEEVRKGIGSDKRIGYEYLYPGVGFGGPNFADDVAQFSETILAAGCEGKLLQAVLDINIYQREVLFRKAWRHFRMNLKGLTFAVWGLSYKPNSASIKNAPSIFLIEALLDQGAVIKVFDPSAIDNAKDYFHEREGLFFCESPYACIEGADALVVMTEWKVFWAPDFEHIKTQITPPVIFDGRNLYNPSQMESLGITYYGIGRGSKIPFDA